MIKCMQIQHVIEMYDNMWRFFACLLFQSKAKDNLPPFKAPDGTSWWSYLFIFLQKMPPKVKPGPTKRVVPCQRKVSSHKGHPPYPLLAEFCDEHVIHDSQLPRDKWIKRLDIYEAYRRWLSRFGNGVVMTDNRERVAGEYKPECFVRQMKKCPWVVMKLHFANHDKVNATRWCIIHIYTLKLSHIYHIKMKYCITIAYKLYMLQIALYNVMLAVFVW